MPDKEIEIEEPEEVEPLVDPVIIEIKEETLPEELIEIPEDSLEDEANLNPVGKDALEPEEKPVIKEDEIETPSKPTTTEEKFPGVVDWLSNEKNEAEKKKTESKAHHTQTTVLVNDQELSLEQLNAKKNGAEKQTFTSDVTNRKKHAGESDHN